MQNKYQYLQIEDNLNILFDSRRYRKRIISNILSQRYNKDIYKSLLDKYINIRLFYIDKAEDIFINNSSTAKMLKSNEKQFIIDFYNYSYKKELIAIDNKPIENQMYLF